MDAAGVEVEFSKGEAAAGQHEINLRYAEALEMADRHTIYKNGAKEIAALNGRSITFMAKWSMAEVGSSCHLHSSVRGAGEETARHWLGGLMATARELAWCFAPYVNSYKRYQPDSWAPTAIVWGRDNRTCGFRLVPGRVESRIPGADANPYIAYAAPTPAESFATCSTEGPAGSLQNDPSCDYHMWVVACQPVGSGVTCGDGTGLIPGSAGAAHEVDANMTTAGTDLFPTIAAGDPGKVDVGWLNTNEIVPTDPGGKFDPGGCAGPGGLNPTFYPPICHWQLHASQSLDLNLASAASTWNGSQISNDMHVGDICNLGIACGPTSNRDLLDFNQETVDVTTGCAHIAYADEVLGSIRSANQVDGPSIIGTGTCGGSVVTPEAPWASLLLPVGVAAALLGGEAWRRRRRTRTLVAG